MARQLLELVRSGDGSFALREMGNAAGTLFPPPQELLQSGINLDDPTLTGVWFEPNDVGPGGTWTRYVPPGDARHAHQFTN